MKKAKKQPARKKELLMPGQFHAGPVTVVAPYKVEEGGVLRGFRKYIVESWRTEGDWRIELQWIETRAGVQVPIVIELPHRVCERLAQQRETILEQSRKLGAMKAHLTATAKAREREAQKGGERA